MLTRSIAAAIGVIDPQLALTFRPLADQVNAGLIQERLVALLAGFFGGLALFLAAIGLYGVTAYAVSRRRHEIGVRMALGAAPGRIVWLVLRRVFVLVGIGVVVGITSSIWAAQFVASLLYGLEPRDPATLIGAILVLAGVGTLAGWLPARRASRVEPAEVLRNI
jgi:ABC-type antimicrobial peptide transport system permease subunit